MRKLLESDDLSVRKLPESDARNVRKLPESYVRNVRKLPESDARNVRKLPESDAGSVRKLPESDAGSEVGSLCRQLLRQLAGGREPATDCLPHPSLARPSALSAAAISGRREGGGGRGVQE